MIEHRSRPHHLLLIMKSNNACPKTASNIAAITTSPIDEVNQAFKALAVEGFVVNIDLVHWQITRVGEQELFRLARTKLRKSPTRSSL